MSTFTLVPHAEFGTVFKNTEGLEIQAVNSLYLVSAIETLSETDPSVKTKGHDVILRDIRSTGAALKALREKVDSADSLEIETKFTRYLMMDGTYVDSGNKTRPLIYMSPDMCLLAMSGYSLSIRASILEDLRKAEELLRHLTGIDIPPVTLTGYLAGTDEAKYRELGYQDLMNAMRSGYFKLNAVFEEWMEITEGDHASYFEAFPVDSTRFQLSEVSAELGHIIKPTLSDNGNRSPLYHIDVLEAVFGETLDLTFLRNRILG